MDYRTDLTRRSDRLNWIKDNRELCVALLTRHGLENAACVCSTEYWQDSGNRGEAAGFVEDLEFLLPETRTVNQEGSSL